MSNSQQFINANLYPKKASAELIRGGWAFKNLTNDTPGIAADVVDTTGFAHCQDWYMNGALTMYYGSIIGFKGFINNANDDFFFGNVGGDYYVLLNKSAGGINFAVASVVHTMLPTGMAITGDVTLTGALTDGTNRIIPAHKHDGTTDNGNVIPHSHTAYTVTGGSPQRALNTTYTNNTGRVLHVKGDFTVLDNGTGNGIGYVDCKTDTNTPPTTVRQQVGDKARMVTSSNHSWAFDMYVQPSHRYRVDSTNSNSTLTLNRWNETQI